MLNSVVGRVLRNQTATTPSFAIIPTSPIDAIGLIKHKDLSRHTNNTHVRQ